MKKILVIDDDVELCGLLEEYFTAEGFSFESARSGDQGLAKLIEGGADIVVLDVMLPGRDGFDVLRDIRGRSGVPVIMLTAKGDPVDRVVGLEIGADDYICKPFNTRELVARIRAVLRRAESATAVSEEVLRVGDLEMNTLARSVTVSGRGVSLTTIEFRLLEFLLTNAGRLATLEDLSKAVLKRPYSSCDRSLSVHMSNLRKKIGDYPTGDDRISTIRGEGFIYVYPKNTEQDQQHGRADL